MQCKGTEFFVVGFGDRINNKNHYIDCPEQNNVVITFKVQLSPTKKKQRLYVSSH